VDAPASPSRLLQAADMRFPELQTTALTNSLAHDPATTGMEVRELQYLLRWSFVFEIPHRLVTAPGHEAVRGAVIEPEFRVFFDEGTYPREPQALSPQVIECDRLDSSRRGVCFVDMKCASGRNLAASGIDRFCHIFFQFWNDVCELPCNLFLQHLQCFRAALEHLVHPLYCLDEFAREDVRISRVLDVICHLRRDVYIDRPCGSRKFHQILDKRLAIRR
jgi:hypothetical protein